MARLRTALTLPNSKSYLFFDDDTYHRYDAVTGVREQTNLSVPDNWSGLTHSPDAFFWWGAGKAYAFTGSTYVRYDERADHVDPDYLPPNPPFVLAGNWTGLPAEWESGIDTALNLGNGKIYLFRGDSYVRYDITADRVDPDYPLLIDGHWPGLFPRDLAAALYPGGQFAYFFRDDRYQRYDLDADAVDFEDALANLSFTPAPPGGVAPARLLTPDQANKLTLDLIARGKLTLKGRLDHPGRRPAPGRPATGHRRHRLRQRPQSGRGVLRQRRSTHADRAVPADQVDQRIQAERERTAAPRHRAR
ncbi:hemopexin repeat-containing protein [Streptomyces sp. NRRL S-1448]|uniref:hemopexin repeat-containing protein n=1 Tax=Streptomyces sp. NRRL S-1448 TaxID=1463883 RepID=UPI00099CB701|nr:hemopexin repeat-containing protein [Streptomyces sp. NRRL S-1448]